MRKTKAQISSNVTMQLISAFVFTSLIEQSQYILNPKSQACNHLCFQVFSRRVICNTYLSSVAARIYLPLGENFTNDTGGFSSSERRRKDRSEDYDAYNKASLPENLSSEILENFGVSG